MRLAGILAALAACYRAPHPNEACAITCDGECPGGLTCQGGYCVEEGQVCHPAFTQVTAGAGFACAIESPTGALWCWGGNTHHQLAPEDRLQFPLATRIDERTWDAVDAGGEHVCGIAGGALLCWGRNDHGQAGQVGPDDVRVPTVIDVAGVAHWTAVAAGAEHSCAIGDGRVYCWGHNTRSALGTGSLDDIDVPAPTPVVSELVDWTAVAAGDTHTCAISSGTGAFCWGSGASGQLGPAAAAQQPTPVLALTAPVTAIATAGASTCATDGNGALLCWGDNTHGELGELNAAVPSSSTPLPASKLMGWSAVAGDAALFCGLSSSDVYCWGAETLGGLGNGVWSESKKFGKVLGGASAIAVGYNRAEPGLELGCALVGGDVACWGDNRYGQLGRGAATLALAPGEVAGGHAFAQLAVGDEHACGIENGELLCWGSTVSGQTTGVLLGSSSPRAACVNPTDCDIGAPTPIAFAAGATTVATGLGHTCALHNDLITCWGLNNAGELGTSLGGPVRRDVPLPNGRPWAELFPTGREGQCASPGGGETWCWGAVVSIHAPAPETALANMRAVSAGAGLVCALDAAGMLLCAGDNSRGQFGNGAPGVCGDTICNNNETIALCPNDCSVGPLATLGRAYTAISVSTGGQFACGVTPSAAVECWGANERGQTGAVEGVPVPSPVDPTLTATPVAGLVGCTAVTCGAQHACALCGGQIQCWGDDRVGELGTGALDGQPVPFAQTIPLVLDGDPWVALGSGASFSCARSTNGRVFCWGSDPHAGLGNGATSANLPVTVLASPIE